MKKWLWWLVAAGIAVMYIPGIAHSRLGDSTAIYLLWLGIIAAFGCLVVLLLVARFFSRRAERSFLHGLSSATTEKEGRHFLS